MGMERRTEWIYQLLNSKLRLYTKTRDSEKIRTTSRQRTDESRSQYTDSKEMEVTNMTTDKNLLEEMLSAEN